MILVSSGLATPSASALHLVSKGQAACALLLPAEPGPSELAAAQVLQRYLRAAAGPRLQIRKEPAAPDGNIISVGHTDLARKAGITEEGLIYDGYRLAVRGNVLYVFGRDVPFDRKKTPGWCGTRGTYRAAFGILEEIGFRWVVPGGDRQSTKGVRIPEFPEGTLSVAADLDITHNPPFIYSIARFDRWREWTWANGFGRPIRLFTRGGHTWDTFVSAALWDEHPEYFAMDKGGQRLKPAGRDHFLCPTNPDVIGHLAEGIRKKFDEGYDLVQLGQSDGFKPCHCPRCRALGEGYETRQVHVAHRKAIELVGKTHPNKQVLAIIYGPTKSRDDAVGVYPANTVFEICSADEDTIKYWAPKAPGGATVYVYYFGLWQRRGLLPKQSMGRIAREVRKLHSLGIRGIYWCGGCENWDAEGPVYYAIGRLMKDPTARWQTILDEYCHALFGEAAPVMVRYYNLIHSRLGRDDGGLLVNEAVVKNYPATLLEKADTLLALAKRQAKGDERAANWLRLVEYSHRHLALTARVCHLYAAYEINRTVDNLKQVRDAVVACRELAGEIEKLGEAEPAFVKQYFPNYGIWRKHVRTNGDQLGSPFKWNFDAILASGMLPGKDRRRGVIPRLAKAPVIDGKFDDEAWKGVKAQALFEICMGAIAAPTRVKMGYDDRNMYFAVECDEPLMEEMVVQEYKRDGFVWRTECVELLFDPEAEGAKLLHFIASPTKTGVYDGRRGYIDDPLHPLVLRNREDASWDPEWRHAFAIDKTAKRWTLEIAIPFKSLGVPPPVEGERWRANIARERNKNRWNPRKYRSAPINIYAWSPNLQKVSLQDQSVFGDLYFGAMPEKR